MPALSPTLPPATPPHPQALLRPRFPLPLRDGQGNPRGHAHRIPTRGKGHQPVRNTPRPHCQRCASNQPRRWLVIVPRYWPCHARFAPRWRPPRSTCMASPPSPSLSCAKPCRRLAPAQLHERRGHHAQSVGGPGPRRGPGDAKHSAGLPSAHGGSGDGSCAVRGARRGGSQARATPLLSICVLH